MYSVLTLKHSLKATLVTIQKGLCTFNFKTFLGSTLNGFSPVEHSKTFTKSPFRLKMQTETGYSAGVTG